MTQLAAASVKFLTPKNRVKCFSLQQLSVTFLRHAQRAVKCYNFAGSKLRICSYLADQNRTQFSKIKQILFITRNSVAHKEPFVKCGRTFVAV